MNAIPHRAFLRRYGAARGDAQELSETLTWREDLVTAGLSVVLLLGLYLDGWNHINLQANELGAFLTPWHGLLYLGYTLLALWIISRSALRLPHLEGTVFDRLRAVWDATPSGYRPALIGMAMVSVAAPGDAVWHSVFGVETGVARVIGPFHLVLFTGMGMMAATPLRSAWLQVENYPVRSSLRHLLPGLISLAMLGGVGGFLIQFTSAFVIWTPSISRLEALPQAVTSSPALLETVDRAAVSQVLLITAVLMIPLLVGLMRWELPFGSGMLLFASVGLLSAALNELALPPVLIGVLAAGLTADLLISATRGKPLLLSLCLVGGLVPLVLWVTFFIAMAGIESVTWPRDLWLGATTMAGTVSAMFALLIGTFGVSLKLRK